MGNIVHVRVQESGITTTVDIYLVPGWKPKKDNNEHGIERFVSYQAPPKACYLLALGLIRTYIWRMSPNASK